MWAPTPHRFLAPTRPLRVLGAVVLVAALLVFILVAALPGAFLPGITRVTDEDGQEVLHFQSGDRYFWLNHDPATPLPASSLLAPLR